jgi:ABC-2 type transport system permease protein
VRLVLVHARAELIQLARYPTFAVPTLAFPSLLMLLYGYSATHQSRQLLMVSFAAFAVLSIAFFQFGVSIAIERQSSWNLFLRTLPVSAATRIGARLLAGSGVAVASAGTVVVVALASGAAPLAPLEWVRLGIVLMAGSVPFAFLGIGLGYAISARAALPVANLLYFLLGFLGGLFTGPRALPPGLDSVARYLPTRAWAELVWAVSTGSSWERRWWLLLGAYTIGFAIFARWAYQRDEGQRYR